MTMSWIQSAQHFVHVAGAMMYFPAESDSFLNQLPLSHIYSKNMGLSINK